MVRFMVVSKITQIRLYMKAYILFEMEVNDLKEGKIIIMRGVIVFHLPFH